MASQIPDDGRYLDDDEQTPFFSFKVRRPKLIDMLAIILLGSGCALFYNSYIDGSHGIMAERRFLEEKGLLSGQSAILDNKIYHQKNLNHRLSDTFLDLDLLEERARKLLGYVHPDDLMITQ